MAHCYTSFVLIGRCNCLTTINRNGLWDKENLIHNKLILLAPNVRKVDNVIHWINLYPVYSAACFASNSPLDGDYPLDSVICPLNNWGQICNTKPMLEFWANHVPDYLSPYQLMRHSVEYPLSKFKLLISMKYLFLQDLNLWKLSIQRKHSHNFLNRRQLFQVTWRKTVLKTSSIPYKPALASVHSPVLFLEMQRDVQIRIWNMWVHSKTCINRDEKKGKKT